MLLWVNPDNPDKYGGPIRTFFPMHQESVLSQSDWGANFWDELFIKAQCIRQPWEQDLDISAGSLTRPIIDEVQAALESHYSRNLRSSAIDSKADAILSDWLDTASALLMK